MNVPIDISDHELDALTHNQLRNLVKDLRKEAKEDLVVPTLVRAVKMAKNWIERSGKEPASYRADVLYAINTSLSMVDDSA